MNELNIAEPSIAVLMATYNGADFVSDQISTVRGQASVDVRILIRDDGSDDATLNIVTNAAACDPAIVVMDSGGQVTGSAGRNFIRMLLEADFGDAQYVALADQDDIWLTGKLRRAVDRLLSTGSDGYSSNLIAFDNEGQEAPWVLRKHGPSKSFDHFFQGASAGCTYVLTRTAINALRPWLATVEYPADFGVSHDWLIHAFVRSSGLRWVYDDRALVLYRQHARNVYGSRRGIGNLSTRIGLLRNHWYRRHILWIGEQVQLSPDETQLMARLRRMALPDRLWLILHAGKMRRRWQDVFKLRLALLTGLF